MNPRGALQRPSGSSRGRSGRSFARRSAASSRGDGAFPGVAAPTAALLGLVLGVAAEGGDLTVLVQVDAGAPIVLSPTGVVTPGGFVNYQDSVFDIEFNLSFDVNGAVGGDGICGPASLNPGILLVNTDLAEHTFLVRFTHAATPTPGVSSVSAASVGGSFTADTGGGSVASAASAPIFLAKVDSEVVLDSYEALAIMLPKPGSASLTPDCSWDPLDYKPPVIAALSVEYKFKLSGGEQIGLTSALVAGPPPCPDLDKRDGVDGADLGLLLAQWGGCGDADLNYDGAVDGGDLGLLLAAFGLECPSG